MSCTIVASTPTTGALRFISSAANSSVDFIHSRIGYRSGDIATIEYAVGHVDDDTTTFMAPTVTWLRDGVPVSAMPTNTPGNNGRLTTTLSFMFEESDAGVYQCVFTDITHSQVFVTDPIRVDTGEEKFTVENCEFGVCIKLKIATHKNYQLQKFRFFLPDLKCVHHC